MKCVALLLLSAIPATCFTACSTSAEKDPAKDVVIKSEEKPPRKNEREKINRVPIDSIYATRDQMGIKQLPQDAEDPARKELSRLMQEFPYCGTSNVFLVHGKDIRSALNATRFLLTVAGTGEIVAKPAHDDKHEKVWLVIYLGVTRRTLVLRSVEQSGNVIKATYGKVDADPIQGIPRYFYWAPLGKLADDDYQLQLLEENEKLPWLTRRVKVSKN